MRIGITERGDAGLDLSWVESIGCGKMDGYVLITKNLNNDFMTNISKIYKSGFDKIVVHCTCTGWGSTIMEPNVPKFETQLNALFKLINVFEFPKENCVLRIDPIIPTNNGLKRVNEVIKYAYNIGLLPDMRVRISVMDEYAHIKERFINDGISPIYGEYLYAPNIAFKNVENLLNKWDLKYECCAEPMLKGNKFEHIGCISEKDLKIMNLDYDLSEFNENPQNRYGCKCLSCKVELLNNLNQCNHKCLYCYWK